MYRRLRFLGSPDDAMDEMIAWVSDAADLHFTAWIFPASSIESVYTT